AFKVRKPATDVTFYVEANGISSKEYLLDVIAVPSIANFEMMLNFPAYLKRKPELVRGTGNAILPEGTQVTWKMNTISTDQVKWRSANQVVQFVREENIFRFSKKISDAMDYEVITSNGNISDYEKLSYRLSVIKDQFPTISVTNAPDSLKIEKTYVLGQV